MTYEEIQKEWREIRDQHPQHHLFLECLEDHNGIVKASVFYFSNENKRVTLRQWERSLF